MSDGFSNATREMPLLLGGFRSIPKTILLISVPDANGVVHIRGWSADDWSAPPGGRAERAAALLEWLERQSSAGRTMNQSLYAVRLWLRGEGGGGAQR